MYKAYKGDQGDDMPCKCINLESINLPNTLFRTNDVWLVIVLTIGLIGTLVCVVFIFWIAYRATNCFSDYLTDASQAFTLLLLAGFILIYASILPYAIHADPVVCALRSNCVPLAYTIVFSTMLSRSGIKRILRNKMVAFSYFTNSFYEGKH